MDDHDHEHRPSSRERLLSSFVKKLQQTGDTASTISSLFDFATQDAAFVSWVADFIMQLGYFAPRGEEDWYSNVRCRLLEGFEHYWKPRGRWMKDCKGAITDSMLESVFQRNRGINLARLLGLLFYLSDVTGIIVITPADLGESLEVLVHANPHLLRLVAMHEMIFNAGTRIREWVEPRRAIMSVGGLDSFVPSEVRKRKRLLWGWDSVSQDFVLGMFRMLEEGE